MTWNYNPAKTQPAIDRPILLEGLPGVGNCGKVAVDFIVDATKARKIGEFSSNHYPHTAFVNERNLIQLPRIELYAAPEKKLLFLVGDVQPIDEPSCYEFCESLLDVLQGMNCSHIVTMGGIGLRQLPKKPRVFCTGTGKQAVEKFAAVPGVERDLHGFIGPIVGVTGVLAGLAKQKNIPATVLLAETYGHPMHLGIKGARELLRIVNTALKLKLDLKELDNDLVMLEAELLKRTREVQATRKQATKSPEDTNYIG